MTLQAWTIVCGDGPCRSRHILRFRSLSRARRIRELQRQLDDSLDANPSLLRTRSQPWSDESRMTHAFSTHPRLDGQRETRWQTASLNSRTAWMMCVHNPPARGGWTAYLVFTAPHANVRFTVLHSEPTPIRRHPGPTEPST